MSSTTSRLGLYKPEGDENVNVTTDLNNNWDVIDLAPGFRIVTSGTRPAAPFSGQAIAESDTSYRTFFSNGTAPASASWVEIPNSSGTFGGDLNIAGTISASNFPSGAWPTWTPTWTTSTGSNSPSFGNAAINTQYVKIGRLVIANFSITFGSTTNFGGGTAADNWRFAVPVTAAAGFECVGFVELHQSATSRCIARCRMTGNAFFELEISSGLVGATTMANTGLVDAVTPWTWANGNSIKGSIQYQAAS